MTNKMTPEQAMNALYKLVGRLLPAENDSEAREAHDSISLLRDLIQKTEGMAGIVPYAYTCPAKCGCIWRDNLNGTMSLFGPNSQSCDVCEHLPLSELTPLYSHSQALTAPRVPEGLEDYDAGLLNDYGGGNVSWWHDYIRYEVDKANDWWRQQIDAGNTAAPVPAEHVANVGSMTVTMDDECRVSRAVPRDAADVLRDYTDKPREAAPAPAETASESLTMGGRYNFIGQKDRLVYVGKTPLGWHQFEKVEAPGIIWAEIRDSELHLIERSAPAPADSELARLRERVKELEARESNLLSQILDVANVAGDGVPDAIDNDGQPYQSKSLSILIAEAASLRGGSDE